MTFTNILPALKKAMPGIDTGNILEGADSLIFKNNRIYSYNDSISISTPFNAGEDIKFIVKAKEFYSIVNKFKQDEIEFKLGEQELSLKCGRAKASFTLLKDTLGMSISALADEQVEWERLPDNFKENLMKCIIEGNSSYSIAGIYMNEKSMFSTDGLRINYFPLKSPVKRLWVSNYAANIILKVGDFKEYCLSKNWVHFRDVEGTVLSCRRLNDEKYPEQAIRNIVESHVKQEGDLGAELPTGFVESIKRASSLSIDIDSHKAIELTFAKDSLGISSRRISGSYDESLLWEKPFVQDFEPIKVYVDNSMVENGLFYSKSFYLKTIRTKGEKITRIVFANEDGMHILGTLAKE